MSHLSIGSLGSIRPQMEDDTVGLGRDGSNLLGLRIRHIQHLDAACRYFNLVVMIVLIPNLQRNVVTRYGFRYEILDVGQQALGSVESNSKHCRISEEISLQ